MKKLIERIWKSVVQGIPIILMVIFISLFWQNSILLGTLMLITIIGSLLIRYDNGEIKLMIIGGIIATVVEIIVVIATGERFANPIFLGIPVWIPLIWAYGLVTLRRILVICETYIR